ncbi:hypothetical protein BLOT_012297 [Blomia tropicalis]|nr:hypothetical protein BLOT_012297 [Blomia tropicalis]
MIYYYYTLNTNEADVKEDEKRRIPAAQLKLYAAINIVHLQTGKDGIEKKFAIELKRTNMI